MTLVEGEGLGLVVGVLSACCNNSLDPLFVLCCLPFPPKGWRRTCAFVLAAASACRFCPFRFLATPIEPWLATVELSICTTAQTRASSKRSAFSSLPARPAPCFLTSETMRVLFFGVEAHVSDDWAMTHTTVDYTESIDRAPLPFLANSPSRS